jgi:alkylmercury lyase
VLRRLMRAPGQTPATPADLFAACDDPPLARALLRELAKGRPVAPESLPAPGGSAALDRWPNVERDEHGRIVAFSGLTLEPTAHRFTVGGRQLHTWCAWDTLFLPALLDQAAHVRSSCPVTGTEVQLDVAPSGVSAVAPEPLWVSFPARSTTSATNLTATFCCHVHFLASRSAADDWLGGHPGGTVLTLQDAFELGRHAIRCCAESGVQSSTTVRPRDSASGEGGSPRARRVSRIPKS